MSSSTNYVCGAEQSLKATLTARFMNKKGHQLQMFNPHLKNLPP